MFVDAVPPTLEVDPAGQDDGARRACSVHISAADQLGAAAAQGRARRRAAQAQRHRLAAKLVVKGLAQGRHVLIVTAADRGGNVVSDKQTFIVDSTEHFGSAVLWPGARGKDVRELQSRLDGGRRLQRLQDRRLRRRTKRPSSSFQERYGLEADGIVGGVDAQRPQRPDHRRPGRPAAVPVPRRPDSSRATRSPPARPSTRRPRAPTRDHLHDRWTPPGTRPTPTGPRTPSPSRRASRTRSARAGSAPARRRSASTARPDDASIGTYASHGCIRMHISDAEDLFAARHGRHAGHHPPLGSSPEHAVPGVYLPLSR